MSRYGTRKKVKIFLWDYQGDFLNQYVTLDGASKFSIFDILFRSWEKPVFYQKKHVNTIKKICPKLSCQFFDMKGLVLIDAVRLPQRW